jgi:hypothetical protein
MTNDITTAFIFVDAERPETREGALKWKEQFDMKVGTSGKAILIVNKIDLVKDVDYNLFCQQNGFYTWMATSIKDDTGVKEAGDAMIELCKDILNIKPEIKEKSYYEMACETLSYYAGY